MLGTPAGRAELGLTPLPRVEPVSSARIPADVAEIILTRCSMCHSREPVWAGFAMAPKGIRLDTPDQIVRAAPEIRIQAVATAAMPPNNVTQMTAQERRVLAAWLGKL
jgi:uncharacterized membrane protein